MKKKDLALLLGGAASSALVGNEVNQTNIVHAKTVKVKHSVKNKNIKHNLTIKKGNAKAKKSKIKLKLVNLNQASKKTKKHTKANGIKSIATNQAVININNDRNTQPSQTSTNDSANLVNISANSPTPSTTQEQQVQENSKKPIIFNMTLRSSDTGNAEKSTTSKPSAITQNNTSDQMNSSSDVQGIPLTSNTAKAVMLDGSDYNYENTNSSPSNTVMSTYRVNINNKTNNKQYKSNKAKTKAIQINIGQKTKNKDLNTKTKKHNSVVKKAKKKLVKAKSKVAKVKATKTKHKSKSYKSNLSAKEKAAKRWIAFRESSNRYTAQNGSCYGKYQLQLSYLHGDLSPANQEKTADRYVKGRYGSWQNAKRFWVAHHWY